MLDLTQRLLYSWGLDKQLYFSSSKFFVLWDTLKERFEIPLFNNLSSSSAFSKDKRCEKFIGVFNASAISTFVSSHCFSNTFCCLAVKQVGSTETRALPHSIHQLAALLFTSSHEGQIFPMTFLWCSDGSEVFPFPFWLDDSSIFSGSLCDLQINSPGEYL